MKGFGSYAPFGLRMTEVTKEAIRISAETNRRSMNSEVLERLEASLRADGFMQQAIDSLNKRPSGGRRT